MVLTVTDRVLFPGIIPQAATRTEMVALKSIHGKYEFTLDEIEKFGLRSHQDGTTTWQSSENIETTFSEFELEVITGNIKSMPVDRRYTLDEMQLIEKFIPDFFQ